MTSPWTESSYPRPPQSLNDSKVATETGEATIDSIKAMEAATAAEAAGISMAETSSAVVVAVVVGATVSWLLPWLLSLLFRRGSPSSPTSGAISSSSPDLLSRVLASAGRDYCI